MSFSVSARGTALRVTLAATMSAVGTVLTMGPFAAYAGTEVLAQAQERVVFDIPAQPLAQALIEFGRQTGLQASVDSGLAAGKTASPVQGEMAWNEALQTMLSGTGLVFRRGGDMITLIAQAEPQFINLAPIVVSGEKVRRRYKDTMTSVGIATGEDIEDYKLDELSDVYDTMANVRYFKSGNGNNGMQIRGVNADGISAPENSSTQISVIVDGVTQSSEALRRGSRGVWDVDQVEVLRGPQSSLQGRNAMSGAIVVETNDPTYFYEGAARGTVGNQERRDGAVMLSGPIVEDQVAVRFSAERSEYETDTSFADDADRRLAKDEFYALRGKVLVEPEAVPDLRVELQISKVKDTPSSSTVSDPSFYDRIYDSNVNGYSTAELRENTVHNYSADIGYELSDGITIRSVSAYHNTRMNIGTAPGNTLYSRRSVRRNHDLSQDLRLELDGDDPLTGTIGLFYGDFKGKGDSELNLDSAIVRGFGDHTILANSESETVSRAAYADLRYTVIDDVHLLGGLRYQRDKVSNYIYRDVQGLAQNAITDILYDKLMDNTVEHEVLLPKVGVAYDLTADRTVGITSSRGYRQGFSQIVDSTNTQVVEVNPEYVWTTELAYRDESVDGLSAGVNLFYNSYKDQQVTVTRNGQLFAENAARSFSYGMEVEGRYRFSSEWQGYGALGLLQTEIEELNSTVCRSSNNICDGNEFPDAPNVTASLGATYTHASGFFWSGDANYTDNYFSYGSIDNKAIQRIGGRFLANTRVGYRYNGLKATLFVDNLLDKNYMTGVGSSGTEASVGNGRTYGFELKATF